MQELLKASQLVNLRLQALEVFDAVKITLESGPPELPGTANVIIEIVETANPLSGQIGAYTKAEVKILSSEFLSVYFSMVYLFRFLYVWLLRNWWNCGGKLLNVVFIGMSQMGFIKSWNWNFCNLLLLISIFLVTEKLTENYEGKLVSMWFL